MYFKSTPSTRTAAACDLEGRCHPAPNHSSFDETWGLTAPRVSCTATVKSLKSVPHPSPQES
eukprot:scaffold45648_cov64-Phaeocystis_antarctica.AAC.2